MSFPGDVFDETLIEEPVVLPTRTRVDKFGVKKLQLSVPGCREFYLPPLDINPVDAINRIGHTEMVVRGNGSVNPHIPFYVMNGSPRLYIYKPIYPEAPCYDPFGNPTNNCNYTWEEYHWHNVEMTCYYNKPVSDSNNEGIALGATGFHHLGGTNARVYYLKHHFESRVFTLQKENKHHVPGQDYVVFQPPDQPEEVV